MFGMAPRIAVASLLAFLVGSFVNAYVMSRMKISSQGKNFSARAILSTIYGEGADSYHEVHEEAHPDDKACFTEAPDFGNAVIDNVRNGEYHQSGGNCYGSE